MRPTLLLLLLSSVVHAQAPAMRPPPRPPALTPGYSPGTPPETVHTPAGAGASHGSLVPAAKQAPRSPNKRLLPPTKEAGLWAADGAPVGVGGPRLFGVELPSIRDEHGRVVAGGTAECAGALNKAADDVGLRAKVESQPTTVRACMAATAYVGCALEYFMWIGDGLTAAQRGGSPAFHSAKATLEHARALEALLCHGGPLSDEHKAALQAILAKWKATAEIFR